jgi:hypothetical protein
VTITGTFGWYWRGRTEPQWPDVPTIEVRLEAWVTGGADETWLSPPEVVDAALADPAFAAWAASLGTGGGIAELAWYRPELAAWEVGAIDWVDDEVGTDWMRGVLVDPHTGAVVGTIDRSWDREHDGVP